MFIRNEFNTWYWPDLNLQYIINSSLIASFSVLLFPIYPSLLFPLSWFFFFVDILPSASSLYRVKRRRKSMIGWVKILSHFAKVDIAQWMYVYNNYPKIVSLMQEEIIWEIKVSYIFRNFLLNIALGMTTPCTGQLLFAILANFIRFSLSQKQKTKWKSKITF